MRVNQAIELGMAGRVRHRGETLVRETTHRLDRILPGPVESGGKRAQA